MKGMDTLKKNITDKHIRIFVSFSYASESDAKATVRCRAKVSCFMKNESLEILKGCSTAAIACHTHNFIVSTYRYQYTQLTQ